MGIRKIARTLSILGAILALPPGYASAASLFDGVYAGPVTATGVDCAPQGQKAAEHMVATVADGRLSRPARPQGSIRIASDGSYSALLRGSQAASDKHMQVLPNIDGVADGQRLVGRYGTRWCSYTYHLDR
jgi:hypothetical protein